MLNRGTEIGVFDSIFAIFFCRSPWKQAIFRIKAILTGIDSVCFMEKSENKFQNFLQVFHLSALLVKNCDMFYQKKCEFLAFMYRLASNNSYEAFYLIMKGSEFRLDV